MANFITGIISLTIGIVILANVFITTIKNTNQSYTCNANWNGSEYLSHSCPWSSAEIAMWGLITLISIAGIVYGVMNVFGLG